MPRGDLGLRGIALTDAQREQVRSIRESHQKEFEEAGTKLRTAQREFALASQGPSADEAAIRSKATALANAMAEEAILRAKVRIETEALLTPEQLEQLKQRRAEMEKRLQEQAQRPAPGPRRRPQP